MQARASTTKLCYLIIFRFKRELINLGLLKVMEIRFNYSIVTKAKSSSSTKQVSASESLKSFIELSLSCMLKNLSIQMLLLLLLLLVKKIVLFKKQERKIKRFFVGIKNQQKKFNRRRCFVREQIKGDSLRQNA